MSDVTVLAVEGAQITALSVDGVEITVVEASVGAQGGKGPPGQSAFTGGAGIVVVGSEIRLSIGTLPTSE